MTDAVPAFVLAPQTAPKGFVGVFRHAGNGLATGDAPIRWLPGSQMFVLSSRKTVCTTKSPRLEVIES